MKKALIAGASGMVGSLIFDHCLSSSEVSRVTSLVRRATDNNHPKLHEVLISNFADFTSQAPVFDDVDVAFFCIGVYTGQVSKDAFREITVDYAIAFAEALKAQSPDATLCFLSGAGADRQEKSRMAFAKYKGIAENTISNLKLGQFYTFRPAYIYPVKPRKEPGFMYQISRGLYPVIRLFGKNASIKSTELAAAMYHVGMNGAPSEVLENHAILELALP